MKKFKEEKGITLVALIITIVVLLILAAVAIGTVRNSDIIGYAQNAATSYNQAKANEVEALTKYEKEIEKYVPGEKVEYLGDLRLNTKYIMSGKGEKSQYIVFYSNGEIDFCGEYSGKYNIIGNIVETEVEVESETYVKIPFKIIKEEKNDLLTIESDEVSQLYATTTDGLTYLNGRKYVNPDAFVYEINILDEGYAMSHQSGGFTYPDIPVFYDGIIYNLRVWINSNEESATATSADNCETINIGNVIYTRSVE